MKHSSVILFLLVVFTALIFLNAEKAFADINSNTISRNILMKGDEGQKEDVYGEEKEEEKEPQLILSFYDAIYLGSMSVKDVTINIEPSMFNPFVGLEFRFKEREFGVGIELGMGENKFDGTWEGKSGDENRKIDGELTINRKRADLFFRFLPTQKFNVRLAYRYYQLEFKNGALQKYRQRNGQWEKYEDAKEAEATGDLATGLDFEMNFYAGNYFQFHCQLGLSYFFSGKYEYSYQLWQEGDPPGQYTLEKGKATENSFALRLMPGFMLNLNKNLSIFLEYQLYLAIWQGDVDKAEIKDFPGVELSNALILGCNLALNL